MIHRISGIGPVLQKSDWAGKDVEDLSRALEVFYAGNPYVVADKLDAATGDQIFYLSKVTGSPTDISLIAGDVLQNLRSSLDHLVYALVAKAIAPEEPKRVSFPIADSASKYLT